MDCVVESVLAWPVLNVWSVVVRYHLEERMRRCEGSIVEFIFWGLRGLGVWFDLMGVGNECFTRDGLGTIGWITPGSLFMTL